MTAAVPVPPSDAPQVMIVTGASRGIGASIAVRAAAAGFFVVVNYSADATGAHSVVAEIASRGGEAVAAQADVSDPAAVGNLPGPAAGPHHRRRQ